METLQRDYIFGGKQIKLTSEATIFAPSETAYSDCGDPCTNRRTGRPSTITISKVPRKQGLTDAYTVNERFLLGDYHFMGPDLRILKIEVSEQKTSNNAQSKHLPTAQCKTSRLRRLLRPGP